MSLALKFRTAADKLQATIEDKFRDRLTNTPKRLAQAEHARLEGQRLQRTQTALRRLAELHEAGAVPAELAGVRSKAEVHTLMAAKTTHIANGFHSYSVETGRPYYETPEALAAWALLEDETPEQKQAATLRQKINGLQFSNIPGYFPTPQVIVDRMVQIANVQAGDKVLEPSAGHGAIADAAKAHGADVTVIEYNHTLSEILRLKGYTEPAGDFMERAPAPEYDTVLMNPPFEKGQDVEHVQHAFRFLKPGGRLVAVVSEGAFFNSSRKAAGFRDWLNGLGGENYIIPAGAFKESGTGVATRLVVIDAPDFA